MESRPAARAHSCDRVARVVLALALVLGLARFVRLSTWSLWIDEALSWADAHHGIEGGQISNPIGYHLVRFTVGLLGGTPDEFALRILPAVAGWLCIPLTWLAFRRTFGERRAAAASLIVALSSWHVYWSQNARFYTLAQLVSLLAAWAVLAGLARGSRVRSLFGLALAGGAALLHPSAILVAPALALLPLLLQWLGRPVAPLARKPAVALAVAAAVLGLATLGWTHETWRTYFAHKGQGGSFGGALSSAAHFARTSGFYVTPLLGVAALVGVGWAWAGRRGEELLAVGTLVFVGAVALVAALFVRVSAQYVFVAFPWIALVAVMPLARDEQPSALGRRGELAWLTLVCAPMLVTTGLYLTVRHGERPQWREAYQFVASQRAPGEQIFGMEACVGEYYLAPWSTDLRRPGALSWLDYYHARQPILWAKQGRRGWYVVNPEQFLGWDPKDADEFQRFLREECRLVRAWPLYVESRDLSVWVYRSD